MKSYFLKLDGQEEGPYSDTQIAQMFADRKVNRYTPCKLASGGDWKTIDDFLPTLKYGTQLPPPTPKAPMPIIRAPAPAVVDQWAAAVGQPVAIVDLDIPFLSILKLMFKWMAAWAIVAFCFIPVILLFWLALMAVFAALVGGALHHQ